MDRMTLPTRIIELQDKCQGFPTLEALRFFAISGMTMVCQRI